MQSHKPFTKASHCAIPRFSFISHLSTPAPCNVIGQFVRKDSGQPLWMMCLCGKKKARKERLQHPPGLQASDALKTAGSLSKRPTGPDTRLMLTPPYWASGLESNRLLLMPTITASLDSLYLSSRITKSLSWALIILLVSMVDFCPFGF